MAWASQLTVILRHMQVLFGKVWRIGRTSEEKLHQPTSSSPKQGKQKETRIQFKSKQSPSAVVEAYRAFFWLKLLLKFSEPFLKKVHVFETLKVQQVWEANKTICPQDTFSCPNQCTNLASCTYYTSYIRDGIHKCFLFKACDNPEECELCETVPV